MTERSINNPAAASEETAVNADTCKHFYKFEPPQEGKETVLGTCIYCPATQEVSAHAPLIQENRRPFIRPSWEKLLDQFNED